MSANISPFPKLPITRDTSETWRDWFLNVWTVLKETLERLTTLESNTTTLTADLAALSTIVTLLQASHAADGSHNWNWRTPPWDATRFAGDGTITLTADEGDRLGERWGELGKTAVWMLQLTPFSTGGAASNQFRITLPFGRRLGGRLNQRLAYCSDNATVRTAFLQGIEGNSYISVYREDLNNWSNASGNASAIYFCTALEIQ